MEKKGRVRLPSELILLLNSASTKWRENKEDAVEMVRKAYEMAKEYPKEIRYGAIIRIVDLLISFGVVDKALQISRESFKELSGESPDTVLSQANLLVRIARIKEMKGERSSKAISKAFSLLEKKKEKLPPEYLSFSTAILIPVLREQGKKEKAIKKLNEVVEFARTREKNKRMQLLLAEALATLADLEVEKDTEKSHSHYREASKIYEKYGLEDKVGEIAVNRSDIYLKEGEPENALELIYKIKEKVKSKRVKAALLKNEIETLKREGKEKEVERAHSELQKIREEIRE